MASKTSWFEVDKDGLAKLRASTPKSSLIYELVQNCWDTDASYCKVTLEASATRGRYMLKVEDDDPNGFADLSHAWTVFAESNKKDQAEKRGRFNLGEKLVLAMCRWAKIETVSGTVIFLANGERQTTKKGREVGSLFTGEISLTREEVREIEAAMHNLIPPASCATTYNGFPLKAEAPAGRTTAILPTVIGEDLRPSRRKTQIDIYWVEEGDEAFIYEMGIPVVASGDRYNINVLQKVPLTLDRANVTPAFLREVRLAVAEAMKGYITPDDANSLWVRQAAMHPDASQELVSTVLTQRFGDRTVIYDPNDVEANKQAVHEGYVVIHGGMMKKEEWSNVKGFELTKPAGQVFPSKPLATAPSLPLGEVTEGMKRVADFCRWLSSDLWGRRVVVEWVNSPEATVLATFLGRDERAEVITFNVARVGRMPSGLTKELLDLIIHEFGHHFSSDHLSKAFNDALTHVGSHVAWVALKNPEKFEEAML